MQSRYFLQKAGMGISAIGLVFSPAFGSETLPRIGIPGGSIPMGYAPFVAEILKSKYYENRHHQSGRY